VTNNTAWLHVTFLYIAQSSRPRLPIYQTVREIAPNCNNKIQLPEAGGCTSAKLADTDATRRKTIYGEEFLRTQMVPGQWPCTQPGFYPRLRPHGPPWMWTNGGLALRRRTCHNDPRTLRISRKGDTRQSDCSKGPVRRPGPRRWCPLSASATGRKHMAATKNRGRFSTTLHAQVHMALAMCMRMVPTTA